MLKKNLKKVLALTLASVMALSALTACGNKEEKKESTVASESKTESKVEESKTSETVVEEKEFTYPMDGSEGLTWWNDLDANASARYTTLNDTPFAGELAKQTGVEIEFLHPASGQSAEQLSIILASGDMPDLMSVNSETFPGGINAAIGDTIYDLTEAIDKWAPNLKKILEENPDVDKLIKTSDGKYYGFPMIELEDKMLTFQALMIRNDWLEELNLEVPTTIDEWHTMLTKFKDELGADMPLYPGTAAHPAFMSAWGIHTDFSLDDGKVVYGPYDARYKEYLKTVAQWHEEGLFGAAFATTDDATARASILNGETGAYSGSIGSRMGALNPALREQKENAYMIAAPSTVLKEGDVPQIGHRKNYYTGGATVITTSCENLELAVRFLDFGYSEAGQLLYNFGIEGESYNMVDGYPTYTDIIVKNEDGFSIGTMINSYSRGATGGPTVHREEYIEQFYGMAEQTEALEIATQNNMKAHVMPILSYTDAESEELTEIKNNVSTYVETMRLKFSTGVEDVDAKWDEYIKTLESYGIERMIEITQDAYDRFLAK